MNRCFTLSQASSPALGGCIVGDATRDRHHCEVALLCIEPIDEGQSAYSRHHNGAMTAATAALVGVVGTIVGAVAGTLITYWTTRSNMWLTLEHSYDQALQGKRLERHLELFHISRGLPRYWHQRRVPTRGELRRFSQECHNWYFGKEAGGMFLSPVAKQLYIRFLNRIAEAAYRYEERGEESEEPPLTEGESQHLRTLASELRHQLAEDVGTAHPPRFQWAGPASPGQPLLRQVQQHEGASEISQGSAPAQSESNLKVTRRMASGCFHPVHNRFEYQTSAEASPQHKYAGLGSVRILFYLAVGSYSPDGDTDLPLPGHERSASFASESGSAHDRGIPGRGSGRPRWSGYVQRLRG
jgi:hypothetical protein